MSERMQGEGGGTGQTLREVLEELYGQSTRNSGSTSLEIRMSEDVPRTLQETSDRTRQERILRPAQEASEEARQQELEGTKPTDGRLPGRYWQKTKITGIDPMDMPGVATRIAQVRDRVLAPRVHGIDPRPVKVQWPFQYWQKTRIIGKNSLNVSWVGEATWTTQEDQLLAPTAQDSRDVMSYRDLSEGAAVYGSSSVSDQRNEMYDEASHRLEEVRASLGLRTSTDTFGDLQREYEEARAQGKMKQRRIRTPSHGQGYEVMALGETRQRKLRGERRRESNVSGASGGERPEREDARGKTERGSIIGCMRLQSDDGVRGEDQADWISETGITRQGRIRGPRERHSNEAGEDDQPQRRQVRTPEGEEVVESRGREELSAVLDSLEEEFQQKERLSESMGWCEPIPHHRKVSTVQRFYSAFHDPKTLPVYTCMICYHKLASTELKDADWEAGVATFAELRHVSQFRYRKCFPLSEKVLACGECVKAWGKGALSPAGHLHSRLGCEHRFPQELEGLTPVEEKLIALNSCYGFITKYSLSEGQRLRTTYPKHVKGHITVFPNNVEEMATHVLPHPLLKVMDDIHVSWQGAEKPAPKDLSVLLPVQRSVVERALLWLKMNNPLYAKVGIDVGEMGSWGTPPHGVPSQVYDRLRRNEPSVWEKTRTAHLVPPTERGQEEGEQVDVHEILAGLSEGYDVEMCEAGSGPDGGDGGHGEDGNAPVQEVSDDPSTARPKNVWPGSAEVEHGGASEPYILVSRGETFADSHDVRFFAKTFPTLFPVGDGGPRQAEESLADLAQVVDGEASIQAESAACSIVSSRNLGLGTWAREVLQRHGGRFARHVFSFLVFNMLMRMRNHRVSMMSVKRRSFNEVKRIVDSLGLQRLEVARGQLMASGKTTDADVMDLLRSLSLYGYRQPMSRELRLSMRRKIKSLIVRHGTPAIWFTLNPNDITNPVKLRLAAYRTRESGEAEEFLTNLDMTYKRARLAISDPLSSALFFHREISMFFKYYVNVGGDSVLGRVSEYFGAVETNERGSLHMHRLLWLHGNLGLSTIFERVGEGEEQAYRDRVIEYIDSVFTEVRSSAICHLSMQI
ncbi:hypothetical protein DM02DRAFT_706769 [Periconia macrospinosa]|uniref:Uncharacterized protein n=1 Tax=Periconia macrospinosa TaxID=97972 RepID=A0A2V1CZB0_9PLEO|nr:hypothetical protein DM02DRAFT_706769 [Periconia macrospinosa]